MICHNVANTNANATTASVTTQENNSFMSNVMLLSPFNDDGSNSLTSTPSAAMETDQSSYDLQKDMQQQRSTGEFLVYLFRIEMIECDSIMIY